MRGAVQMIWGGCCGYGYGCGYGCGCGEVAGGWVRVLGWRVPNAVLAIRQRFFEIAWFCGYCSGSLKLLISHQKCRVMVMEALKRYFKEWN